MSKIRVSASGFGKIKLDKGYLVALNKSKLKHGKKVYVPFGGAIVFYDTAKPFLESLDVEFEKGNDLRFMMAEDRLYKFREWFYKKENRETSLYRELKEELVDEEKIFPVLPEDKVDAEYLKTVEQRFITDRLGQEGKLTHYFFEIYLVEFDSEYEKLIRKNLAKEDSKLALITEEEIKVMRTDSGTEIAQVCSYFP